MFTRDPQFIKDADILMGMMVIMGIYAKHGVQSLNHGIGFNGAAIELLLPTYGEQLGLKGKDLPQLGPQSPSHPHPRHRGGLGRKRFSLRRRSGYGKIHRGAQRYLLYRCRRHPAQQPYPWHRWRGFMPSIPSLGATLQMDYYGNSSTVTAGRLSGFGGAPNMGHNPGGRRHSSPAYHSLVEGKDTPARRSEDRYSDAEEQRQEGQ